MHCRHRLHMCTLRELMEYFSQIYRIHLRTAHAKQSRRQPFQKWRANRVFHVESPSNPAPVDGKFLAYSPRIDASCMRKNVQNHRWPKRRPTRRARRPRAVSDSGTTARHVSLCGHVSLRRATGIPAIGFPCAHVRITVTCDRDTAAYLCDRIWQNASHASIVACDTHTKHVPQRTSWYTAIFRPYFSIGSTLTCEHMDKNGHDSANGLIWTCNGENLLQTLLSRTSLEHCPPAYSGRMSGCTSRIADFIIPIRSAV